LEVIRISELKAASSSLEQYAAKASSILSLTQSVSLREISGSIPQTLPEISRRSANS